MCINNVNMINNINNVNMINNVNQKINLYKINVYNR